ncbi:ABC transporter substrate-binding protein [Roseomonas sp. BN140053]|uniref:ABC transporter substrate-binding protein n=1 Tax=Roseomonas sp. BN140053 TaxID=3391898 RepID=UPI0039EBE311
MPNTWWRTALAAGCLFLAAAPARAQLSDGVLRIGVMDDMSTGMADTFGQGEVVAARLAVEDFGGSVLGVPVEILGADHQSKPDVGTAIARRWFDTERVDMITGLANSAIGLGVQGMARERNRVTLTTGSGATEFTGAQCSPTGAHWVIDTFALARTVAQPMVRQGLDSWYFVAADITLGRALVRDITPVIQAGQGRVLGSIFHPLLTTDMSSPLVSAQASRAKVVALANVGADAVNSVKQAAEFGMLQRGQQVAGLYMTVTDVKAIGLPSAQGIFLAEAYYWDLDDATRAFARRYAAQRNGAMPNGYQAGVYSAVLHYLRAVQAAGTDAAPAVMARMRELPIEDFMTRSGRLREDGRVIRDVHLFQVKPPGESQGSWDLLRHVATVPGADAFRPISESDCPLVRR